MITRCACGKVAQHISTSSSNDTYQCCECYVKAGNAPSDWHPNCMKAYENLKSKLDDQEQLTPFHRKLSPEELATITIALEECRALFEKDHAIDHFNWGASCLQARDIRELNELPAKILKALAIMRSV